VALCNNQDTCTKDFNSFLFHYLLTARLSRAVVAPLASSKVPGPANSAQQRIFRIEHVACAEKYQRVDKEQGDSSRTCPEALCLQQFNFAKHAQRRKLSTFASDKLQLLAARTLGCLGGQIVSALLAFFYLLSFSFLQQRNPVSPYVPNPRCIKMEPCTPLAVGATAAIHIPSTMVSLPA
jgi:hypothetical protein